MRNYFILVIGFMFSFQTNAQLNEDLLLHYSFNGSYEDNSPNQFDGTPVDIEFSEGLDGFPNSAIELNGSSSRVGFPDVPQLEPDFPITMMALVRFDDLSDQQIIATTDYSSTTHSGAWMQISSIGKVAIGFGNAEGGFNGSTVNGRNSEMEIQEGVWYRIAGIWRGFNDMDIYIDCNLVSGGYSGEATTMGYTAGAGNIGRKRADPPGTFPPHYFDGAIDEFFFWERELSPEEVTLFCKGVLSDDTDNLSSDSNSFEIFPNPSNGSISVEADVVGSMAIYDTAGKEVYQATIRDQNRQKINLELAPGLYVVRFDHDGFFSSKRLVITE